MLGPDGVVQQRIIPLGLEPDLRGADYPLSEALPERLAGRPFGAGFTGLALSGDSKHVYALLAPGFEDAQSVTGGTALALYVFSLEEGRTVGAALYPIAAEAGERVVDEIVPVGAGCVSCH